MVRIAITQAAFDAIAKTLALGSVGYGMDGGGCRLDSASYSAPDKLKGMGESPDGAPEDDAMRAATARGGQPLPASAILGV
jgi:hypothetical protein